MTAAWAGITTVRNARISSMKLSAITTRICSGSFSEMRVAKST